MPVGALAADELSLDDGNPQSARGQRRSAMLAGRAAAQDDDFVVAARVGSSSPACSAAMYAAYHSGEFASATPVRRSCSPWAASARRSALARSAVNANAVSAASIRPGSRVVTSCSNQPLPSAERSQ
jgi:hypothetical protein